VPFAHVNMYSGFAFRQRLKEKRVRIMALHAAAALDGRDLRITDLSTGEESTMREVDSLVAPMHASPDDGLLNALTTSTSKRPLPFRLTTIGDCLAARSALEAVFEGYEAGHAVSAPRLANA
jgi:dimethylglycine catabolism A